MFRLSPVSRVTAALAILLTLVAGVVAPGATAQGGDRITVTIQSFIVASPEADTNPGVPADYPQAFTYLQDAVPGRMTGILPDGPGTLYLVYVADGPITGQGETGADGTVQISIPAGNDYFIINAADTEGYSSTASGAEDGNWTAVFNPYTNYDEPVSGQPSAAPDEPTGSGTGENPANAAPTATTAADTADSDADASAAPGADPSAGASAAPGSAGTGSPATIYAGTCDTADLTADPVAVLSETTAPDGESRGADDASAVETSFTTLDLPLDDILADDHALVVFDEDDDSVALACGAIGGIVTGDGTLAFGLRAVGASRYSGVATLTGNGEQTEAMILLAEDLSPEASPSA